MSKCILVPVDLGEPDSLTKALPVAEALAKAEGAKLHVLYVMPDYNMPIVGSYFPKDREQEVLEEAQAALSEALGKAVSDPSSVKGHVAHGTIYSEILRVADELGADLIVMMAHRPALKDYLLGPNAARVARHASQSVYLVRG